METPLAVPGLVHRKPVKGHCIDPVASPNSVNASHALGDLDIHAEALINDDSLPQHLKVIISCLLQERRRLHTVLDHLRELSDEVINLRAESARLKASVVGQTPFPAPPLTVTPPAIPTSNDKPPARSFEEIERARSIVIARIPESKSELSSARMHHDYDCIRDIMDFLAIDCSTIAVYRMGRFNVNHPRLLKIILPASFYAKQVLRRAPRLRFFKVKGLYIRPSLPKAERDRLGNNVSNTVVDPNLTSQPVAVTSVTVACNSSPLQSTSMAPLNT
ncbi:hypothetical protein Y032_0422g1192 [Ancylostoma ceylanicum]|uniref:Uncharacterized protein n=1 Tax=Ancylostoma ceylanicum TaxID=53326 RepID=A0A016X121_9BILA|nr:hypothetical protein Y032_0422g1192 [Ancylostoma ceylanicum]